MSIKQAFIDGAKVIFNAFDSITNDVVYKSIFEDGFGVSNITETQVKMITDSFAERDVQFLSFSALIQPTDVKGLIQGDSLINVSPATSDKIIHGDVTYSVIAYHIDPAGALYTFLLRKV